MDEEAVRSHVGHRSFVRGRAYFEEGRVKQPQRDEAGHLTATCEGSRMGAYTVQATVGEGATMSAHCSCPVGGAGRCKHVAAVLLTWIHDPDSFTSHVGLDGRLAALTPDELRRALRMLIERDRELAWVLDVVAGPASVDELVDDEPYYDRTFSMLPEEWGWRGTAAAGDALDGMVDIGNEFLASGQVARAGAVFRGALRAAVETYEQYHDEGEISEPMAQCVAGLRDVLRELPADSPNRQPILDVLAQLVSFEYNYGGFDLDGGLSGVLRDVATEEERLAIAADCRAMLRAPGLSSWDKEHLGGFIAELEMDSLDDEAFLALCRETGRDRDVVDRLMTLERHDEADETVRSRGDYELLGFADTFDRHRREQAFVGLLEERSPTTENTLLLQWLVDHYAETGARGRALDLAERIFRLAPGTDAYDRAMGLASEDAADVKSALLASLTRCDDRSARLRVLLHAGENDRAVAEIKAAEAASHHFWGRELADAAGQLTDTHPDVSAELFQRLAAGCIARKGRGSYREACIYMLELRRVWETAGDSDRFTQWLQVVKGKYRRLPALQDEIRKAGLP